MKELRKRREGQNLLPFYSCCPRETERVSVSERAAKRRAKVKALSLDFDANAPFSRSPFASFPSSFGVWTRNATPHTHTCTHCSTRLLSPVPLCCVLLCCFFFLRFFLCARRSLYSLCLLLLLLHPLHDCSSSSVLHLFPSFLPLHSLCCCCCSFLPAPLSVSQAT